MEKCTNGKKKDIVFASVVCLPIIGFFALMTIVDVNNIPVYIIGIIFMVILYGIGLRKTMKLEKS